MDIGIACKFRAVDLIDVLFDLFTLRIISTILLYGFGILVGLMGLAFG